MEVAFLHQMFLQPRLDAFAKQRAVGQHHGGAAVRFQQAHDQGKKQVGRLLGAEGREVVLDAVFLSPAEGRIGEDDIDALVLAPSEISGRASVLSWRTKLGSSMPCSSMLVTQSMCGSCFFSTARKARLHRLALLRAS